MYPHLGAAAVGAERGDLVDERAAAGLEDAVVGQVELAEGRVAGEGGAEREEGGGDEGAARAGAPGSGDAAELVALEVEALKRRVDGERVGERTDAGDGVRTPALGADVADLGGTRALETRVPLEALSPSARSGSFGLPCGPPACLHQTIDASLPDTVPDSLDLEPS